MPKLIEGPLTNVSTVKDKLPTKKEQRELLAELKKNPADGKKAPQEILQRQAKDVLNLRDLIISELSEKGPEFVATCLDLLQNATKNDTVRYQMAAKILDKILPDAAPDNNNSGQSLHIHFGAGMKKRMGIEDNTKTIDITP